MNRKEFTNLLLEWRKNFVNERTFSSFPISSLGTEIPSRDIETLKSIDFPIHMLSVPLPIRDDFGREFTSKSLVGEYEKNETNYNKVRDLLVQGILKGKKENVELFLSNDEIPDHLESYEEASKDTIESATSQETINNLIQFFEDNKFLLNDDLPLFIFRTNLSEGAQDVDGGTYMISQLPPEISDMLVKWTFSHDFYHQIEMLGGLGELTNKNYDDFYVDTFKYIRVPGLEASTGNFDNIPSVIPFVVFKDDDFIKEFVRKNHYKQSDFKKKLEMKFIETDVNYKEMVAISNMSSDEFSSMIDKRAEDAVQLVNLYRESFETFFNSLNNKIVFITT